jgi:tRNA G18 (ribose-2'-O)-methylase SpoU
MIVSAFNVDASCLVRRHRIYFNGNHYFDSFQSNKRRLFITTTTTTTSIKTRNTNDNDEDISKTTLQYQQQQQQQEHTTSPSSRSTSILSPPNQRAVILNNHLQALGRQGLPSLDIKYIHDSNKTTTTYTKNDEYATGIMTAALESLKDPTLGYDQRFGKSALKTYRSFVYPKTNQQEEQELDTIQLEAAAGRTARQIDFLIKRHRSHETEWIRHHDGTTTPSKSNNEKQKLIRRFPIVLVLDNLRSALNVGSLYRTAETCACQEVLTCGITPHPGGNGSDKLRKSALGAEHIVPTQHFRTTQQALQYVRSQHPEMNIVAMETTAKSRLYTEVDYTKYYNDNGGGIALLLGNEVTGVDTELLASMSNNDHIPNTSFVDDIVELPTFGEKNSLNVAACAPVVIYEILRQWKAAT